jgi:organic radical activating enzyme
MDARGDDQASQSNLEQAIAFVQAHPKWRLSLQTHKILGLA